VRISEVIGDAVYQVAQAHLSGSGQRNGGDKQYEQEVFVA
jgi:hypothetical protein